MCFSFSRLTEHSQCVYVYMCVYCFFSHVQLFATLWTLACKAPLSMGFSRQEYWSGLPCPPPGELPNPGVKPASLMSPALAGGFFTTRTTWEAHMCVFIYKQHMREQNHTSIYLLFSKLKSLKGMFAQSLNRSVRSDSETPWTVVCQAPMATDSVSNALAGRFRIWHESCHHFHEHELSFPRLLWFFFKLSSVFLKIEVENSDFVRLSNQELLCSLLCIHKHISLS